MTQDEKILERLLRGETLTPLIAANDHGCLALHSSIARLRGRGHRIDCAMQARGKKRWGAYTLVQRGQIGLFGDGVSQDIRPES